MKNFNKKVITVVGGAALAFSLIALPALADTAQKPGSNWFSSMRSFMQQTFTPAQQQQFMSSSAMLSLHNSPAMQQAMQTGDFGKMQSLMNSDPALRAQIGAQNIAGMNQFMARFQRSEEGDGGR